MKRFYKNLLFAFSALIISVALSSCSAEDPTENSDIDPASADLVGHWVTDDGLYEIYFRDNGTGYTKEPNDEGDLDRFNFDYVAVPVSNTRLTITLTWRDNKPATTLSATVTSTTLTLSPGKTYTRKS